MRLKRSGIITKIIVFTLIIYAAVSLLRIQARIDQARIEQKAVKKLVAEKEISNAELEYKIEHSNDDSVIANIARSELGLVMPGEVVFYESGSFSDSEG